MTSSTPDTPAPADDAPDLFEDMDGAEDAAGDAGTDDPALDDELADDIELEKLQEDPGSEGLRIVDDPDEEAAADDDDEGDV